MADQPEILNSDTLIARLDEIIAEKGEEEARCIDAAIAHRCAMRVLPIYWGRICKSDSARNLGRTALQILRLNLTSGIMAKWPTEQMRNASAAAAASFAADAAIAADAIEAAIFAADAAIAADAIEAVSSAGAAVFVGDIVAADDFLHAVSFDLSMVDEPEIANHPLWHEQTSLTAFWEDLKPELMSANDNADWAYWVNWYEEAFNGTLYRPENEALLTAIALIDDADWEKGPAHIAGMIEELKLQSTATPLASATPADFTFDKLAKVMRLVGIDDNLRHLRDPAIVQSFLDDAEEVRDGLQDFADFASDLQGAGNYAGVLRRATTKVLDELRHVDEKVHLRPERLVTLAQDIELFSKDERAVADIGVALSDILQRRLSALKTLCRQHFGPSYLTLAPLAELSVEKVDQDALVALFDQAIGQIKSLPSEELVALDDEGLAILADMARELHEYRAAIAAAGDDAFRKQLEQRFAYNSGGLGLSVGRFLQRSSEASNYVGATTDVAIKQYKRVKSLKDIWAFLETFLNGAG